MGLLFPGGWEVSSRRFFQQLKHFSEGKLSVILKPVAKQWFTKLFYLCCCIISVFLLLRYTPLWFLLFIWTRCVWLVCFKAAVSLEKGRWRRAFGERTTTYAGCDSVQHPRLAVCSSIKLESPVSVAQSHIYVYFMCIDGEVRHCEIIYAKPIWPSSFKGIYCEQTIVDFFNFSEHDKNIWLVKLYKRFFYLVFNICFLLSGHFLFLQVRETNLLRQASVQSSLFPVPFSTTDACQVCFQTKSQSSVLTFHSFSCAAQEIVIMCLCRSVSLCTSMATLMVLCWWQLRKKGTLLPPWSGKEKVPGQTLGKKLLCSCLGCIMGQYKERNDSWKHQPACRDALLTQADL